MSSLPSTAVANAIDLESGDQLAPRKCMVPKLVDCTRFFPSESHVQISVPPERSDQNATRRPSGEYCGDCSFRVEAIKLAGAWLAVLPFGPLVISNR